MYETIILISKLRKEILRYLVKEVMKFFVNSHLNPFRNGIVISIDAGVYVIFMMLGCRNQSWNFQESLREGDCLKW